VENEGIEPSASCVQGRRSTPELIPRWKCANFRSCLCICCQTRLAPPIIITQALGGLGRVYYLKAGRAKKIRVSLAGTRTRVYRVKADYPNHLDYKGILCRPHDVNQTHIARERRARRQNVPHDLSSTAMRFELTRAKPSRFLVYRLNHSATLSARALRKIPAI
jgi:hypothetical protein